MTKQRILPVRMDEKTYKDLSKLAFLTEIPMAAIVREAIKIKINEHKKVLTNADIAI